MQIYSFYFEIETHRVLYFKMHSMIKYIIPYSSIKFHHYSASLGKSLQEDNSEDDTFHVQASGFRDTKFPLVIFRPKKRSGIIVRVGEKVWDLASEATYDA